MFLSNPPKALVAIIALICLTLLMALDSIDSAGGMGLIGMIVGYAVGNGIAARTGLAVEPIIGKHHHDDKVKQ